MHKYERLAAKLSPAQLDRLASYLDALPEAHRAAVRGVLHGHTQASIAAKLGLSQPRVSQLVKAAFAAIKEVEKAR